MKILWVIAAVIALALPVTAVGGANTPPTVRQLGIAAISVRHSALPWGWNDIKCSPSRRAWGTLVKEYMPGKDPDYVAGFVGETDYNGTIMTRLAPWICNSVRWGPSGDGIYSSPRHLGGALFVISHEMMHVQYIYDESDASCIVMDLNLPVKLFKRFWPNATSRQILTVKWQALDYYYSQPPSYIDRKRCNP